VSPPLVSCSAEPVRAQLPRAAQGQTQSSLAPRSPLPSTSFSCRAYPHHCSPFAIPVISVVIVPPSFPSRARYHCVQLHPLL
jgi:hypothetical protein